MIDDYAEMDIATFDVPGAFLQAILSKGDKNERLLLKLNGEFVDIMCEVNPEYKKNVIMKMDRKTYIY